MSTPPSLFTPLKLGRVRLSSRIAMAPLTRYRADDEHVHGQLAVDYYGQRASVPGTLLITEATFISRKASGYTNAPGIYNSVQVAAWKKVTKAVHDNGSYIFCQLWAIGRAAMPEIVRREAGESAFVSSGNLPMEVGTEAPRPLQEAEIWDYIQDYVNAARMAIEAGFDGVEIHGANGFLIDQFTQDTCNNREDAWGGSVEKRARFGLEVAKAIVDTVGADRTGIRFSPFSTFQGMKMTHPIEQFGYLIKELKKLKLAYLHLVESRIAGAEDVEGGEKIGPLVDIWGTTSPVLLAGGFKPDSARHAVEQEFSHNDVVIVFGRYFISNPDLPFRVQRGIPLSAYNRATFYTERSPDGYTDYPFSEEFKMQKCM